MSQEAQPVPAGAALEDLRRLADAGEIAGPLAHEVNNFLNVLVLNVAVLEQVMPEAQRGELQQIRRQGVAVAELVRQFQLCRRRPPLPLEPLDLHQILHEVLSALAAAAPELGQAPPIHVVRPGGPAAAPGTVPVVLELAADLPPVLGLAADLRRLLSFLLANAAAASARIDGRVRVRTGRGANGVLLRVEDGGPLVDVDRLAHFFDASVPAREGVNRLELAACKALARRLQGKIEAQPCLEAGAAVVVELKTAGG